MARGIGGSVITDGEMWKRNPEKVFGVTSRWNEQNPTTHVDVVKAIIRACQWLDAKDESGRFLNREEACRILAQPQYVGADVEIIANSMTGHYSYQASDRRELPEFNIFFDHFAGYPFYSDCVWYLTQMRRWGQVADAQPDAWYHETARSVYRPDIYRLAAEQLVAEEHLRRADVPWETDGYKPATADFIDGIEYDGRLPGEYLSKFAIGLKD